MLYNIAYFSPTTYIFMYMFQSHIIHVCSHFIHQEQGPQADADNSVASTSGSGVACSSLVEDSVGSNEDSTMLSSIGDDESDEEMPSDDDTDDEDYLPLAKDTSDSSDMDESSEEESTDDVMYGRDYCPNEGIQCNKVVLTI